MSELSHEGATRLIYQAHLNENERQDLRRHLRTCAACRANAIIASVLDNHLVLSELPARPSPRFTAVFKESAARRSRRNHIMKPIYAVGGLAALALLVLAGWFITSPTLTAPPLAIRPIEITGPKEYYSLELSDEGLIAAVTAGDAVAVSRLLQAGIDPNGIDEEGNVPLPRAAEAGQLEIVRLLLDAGADVNSTMSAGIASDPATESTAYSFYLDSAPALVWASIKNHEEVVEQLIAQGADVDQFDLGFRGTALYHAAWLNHAEIIKILLDSGADPELPRAVDNKTPLHVAINNESLGSIQTLLAGGADVNGPAGQGQTPTMELMRKPQWNLMPEVLTLLIESGADANQQDYNGDAALHVAARWGTSEAVPLLIEYGADVNLQDNDGDTALHQAARQDKVEIVSILLENGASVAIENNEGQTAVDVAASDEIEELLMAAEQDSTEAPPLAELLAAIDAGDTAAIEELLADGADPNALDDTGRALLALAARDGQLDVIQLLLDAGADVNSTMDGYLPNGNTLTQASALIYAAARGHLDVVKLLIASGADVNMADIDDGDVPLHSAANFNHVEIVQTLLENGSDPNAQRSGDGMTPLQFAAINGSLQSAEILLEEGADIDLKDFTYGYTPLLFTLNDTKMMTEMMTLLLDAGADVNLASQYGVTPLMAACWTQSEIGLGDRVSLLLERGADPDMQDGLGDTALHYAARTGREEAVELLIQHGAALDIQNNEGQTALDVAANDEIKEMLREVGATGSAAE